MRPSFKITSHFTFFFGVVFVVVFISVILTPVEELVYDIDGVTWGSNNDEWAKTASLTIRGTSVENL